MPDMRRLLNPPQVMRRPESPQSMLNPLPGRMAGLDYREEDAERDSPCCVDDRQETSAHATC